MTSQPSPACLALRDQILNLVSLSFQVTPEQILGRRRFPRIVKARHVSMVALWQMGFTTTAVGGAFNRDHCAVLHAIRKIKRPKP